MKRTERYQNTSTFFYYNANPHHRITPDCAIRAISTGTQIPYDTVIRELAEMSIKTGYAIASKELTDRYLKSKGWVKCKQPRKYDNTKYTGKEFCRELLAYDCSLPGDFCIDRVIAHIGGHHIVAIIEGKVHDIWDSTNGCIGNYWVKPAA